jgi:thymidylate synthase
MKKIKLHLLMPASSEKDNEIAYLSLVRQLLEEGEDREDRTGQGTRSYFGAALLLDIANGILPLLTTRKIYFKGVVRELLWFLRGETDAALLSATGVKIWDLNGSRSFLDSRGLNHHREVDLGPVYGFQWRHFGAEYQSCDADYSGKGVDQIKSLIETIKADPFSRRQLVSAWNPPDIDRMALPPCHVLFQTRVSAYGKSLDMNVYQRSADLALGVPFNMASYALLAIGNAVGMTPRRLNFFYGDLHIYKPHIETMRELLGRKPVNSPRILLNHEKKGRMPWELEESDFVLENYSPQDPLKMNG